MALHSSAPLDSTLHCKILVVEDNRGDFGLARVALLDSDPSLQCEILWAESLTDGLALLEEHCIDVVLLDLGLPDSTGLQGVETMAANAPEVPVVVLTGQDESTVAVRALHCGATDYLNKSELESRVLSRVIRYAIERKKTERELVLLARTDPLTGLMNRTAFSERIGLVLDQSQREGRMCAVMELDLDHFKEVNDTFGHAVGDLLLKEVAQRSRECLRSIDVLARLGGDEFAIVAGNLSGSNEAAQIAQRLLDSLQSIQMIQDQAVNIDASIGIALFPTDSSDPQDLQLHADAALYKAKRDCGEGYCFFDAEMDQLSRRIRRLRRDMQSGLEEQLVAHLQPLVDISAGRVTAAEALARWQHPSEGLMQAVDFIPLAEQFGMIPLIMSGMLREVCRLRESLQEEGLSWFPLCLNVSAQQFHRPGLADMILQALAAKGLKGNCLEIEITESLLMKDMGLVTQELQQLRESGLQIAIDDFGTGHSSLAYLQRLPVDKLKIDRSFVRDVPQDSDSRAIVSAVVNLAKGLKLQVIAEGVENQAQLEFLSSLGVSIMQGYYFSKPLSGSDFVDWCRQAAMYGSRWRSAPARLQPSTLDAA